MKHLLLKNVAFALVVAAVAAPLAAAATPYDGYKSSYPQLHALRSRHAPVTATPGYDGYKSSYPQLHATLSGAATPVSGSGTFYDGYKSSYPQLHTTLSAHVTPLPSRGFDWRDASIGAGTAAGVIGLLAAGALQLMRRRTKLAI